MRKRLSGEFKPWALKAASLRWSFIVLTALLCIVYAVIGAHDWGSCSTLEVLVNQPDLGPFGAFIARFISYAIIILGLASQFAACLLDKKEVESEFRLFPDPLEGNRQTRVVKRYFVLLGIIIAMLFSLIYAGEQYAVKIRNDEGCSLVKTQIEKTKQELILRVDQGKNLATEEAANVKKDGIINNTFNQVLQKQRNAAISYYEGCRQVAGTYVEWYYDEYNNIFNRIIRFFTPLLAGDALEKFKEIMNRSHELFNAAQTYQEAEDTIKSLLGNPESLDELASLSLFESFSNQDRFAEEYLLPKDGESREDLQSRLHGIIEEQRETTLSRIDGFSTSLDLNSMLEDTAGE